MIPQFKEIRVQALKVLNTEGRSMRAKDLLIPLAKHFNLTKEEINAQYPSGNGEIFLSRISWALSYLFISGLAEKPQKGDYKISTQGVKMLSSNTNEEINKYISETVHTKTPKKESSNNTTTILSSATYDDERTPLEGLDDSYNNIKQSIQFEILTTILHKKPQEFEKLVVKLLQGMGYGDEIKDSGIVTKQSNDGGIDGIIKEDILGFNYIFIQAKRYVHKKVNRPEVQSFAGAVAGTPSKKGIFITTSDFTPGAREFVESLNGSPTIILINGNQLTEYIYNYGLGLQTEKVFKVMKMDMDYWDAMDDAK